MCTLMNPAQFQIGVIGAPVPCVEIKLVDVPEANYYSHNKPKPQGEIWVRGPAVTQGYWKRDDVTKETITEDNWLKTGDIGEWNDDGTLNVIDRKKNLVKLSNGEYIALEKLESVYKSCIHITNICVCANPLYPKPVALVMPSEPAIMKLANDNNIKNKGFEDLCADPKMKKLVLNSLLEQGKKAGLKGTELLCDVYICPEEWTVEQVSFHLVFFCLTL